MSATASQLTIAQACNSPAALLRTESADRGRTQRWATLRTIEEQVRALLLAQRSFSGQYGCAAYSAEDDYRRFSNRLPR